MGDVTMRQTDAHILQPHLPSLPVPTVLFPAFGTCVYPMHRMDEYLTHAILLHFIIYLFIYYLFPSRQKRRES